MSNKFSLKLAYILFLIICVLYYVISHAFDCEFENWKRIVCATTIASYFFTIASAKQTIYSIIEKIEDSIKDSNKELCEIKDKMIKSPDKYKDSMYNIEDLNRFIAKDEEFINKCEKENFKNQNLIFLLNTLGFLIFFCILTFTYIYQLFADLQELFTILAFIMILLADAYEEYWIEKHSSLLTNKHMEET